MKAPRGDGLGFGLEVVVGVVEERAAEASSVIEAMILRGERGSKGEVLLVW